MVLFDDGGGERFIVYLPCLVTVLFDGKISLDLKDQLKSKFHVALRFKLRII